MEVPMLGLVPQVTVGRATIRQIRHLVIDSLGISVTAATWRLRIDFRRLRA
jgi:hypothetical protein